MGLRIHLQIISMCVRSIECALSQAFLSNTGGQLTLKIVVTVGHPWESESRFCREFNRRVFVHQHGSWCHPTSSNNPTLFALPPFPATLPQICSGCANNNVTLASQRETPAFNCLTHGCPRWEEPIGPAFFPPSNDLQSRLCQSS